jgi:cation transport ATPase
MVFDKTGTLTEDCLQMIGVRAVSGNLSNKDSLRPYFVDFVADLKMAKKAS